MKYAGDLRTLTDWLETKGWIEIPTRKASPSEWVIIDDIPHEPDRTYLSPQGVMIKVFIGDRTHLSPQVLLVDLVTHELKVKK